MEKLRLSVDVFVEQLKNDVAFTEFSTERNAIIDRFAVYSPDTFFLENSCLYLCLDEAFPPCERIQQGTAIVCVDATHACANAACHRCDIVALKGTSPSAAINKVASVFDRFQALGRSIEMAALRSDGLQDVLDVGEQLLNTPLCLMDVNQDVIAASAHKELFGNPLWESIVRDRKPERCALIDACAREIAPDGPLLRNTAMRAASVSGYSLLARNLLRRGRPCASLWALATEPGRLFGPAKLHLFAWLARCLDEWIDESSLLKTGRGLATERFLLDVADGTLADATAIDAAALKVGFPLPSNGEFQLCAFKSRATMQTIDGNLAMMEEIESSVPSSICALADCGIIALFTLQHGCELPAKHQVALQALCSKRSYNAVLSTAYFNLYDTPRVLRQITDCFSFVENTDDQGTLHLFCDHLVRQIMNFVLASQPPETLLHPIVRKLQAYDYANDTNYLETFKVYLNNRCNAAETSKQLHMHRNTLLHRVKRIEEIAGQSFDSWTLRRTLLLSIDYLYLEEERPI